MNKLLNNDRRQLISALVLGLVGTTISASQGAAQNASLTGETLEKDGGTDAGVVSMKNVPSRGWGKGGMTWELLANPELGVFYEKVSPGTMEVNHYHEKAYQFFFVIKGQLTIKLSSEEIILNELEGFEVKPGMTHQAINNSGSDIEFLAISSPITAGDRVTV